MRCFAATGLVTKAFYINMKLHDFSDICVNGDTIDCVQVIPDKSMIVIKTEGDIHRYLSFYEVRKSTLLPPMFEKSSIISSLESEGDYYFIRLVSGDELKIEAANFNVTIDDPVLGDVVGNFGVTFDQSPHLIWYIDGIKIIPELDAAVKDVTYYRNCKTILALVDNSETGKENSLIGFSENGKQKFITKAPDGYQFGYLITHSKVEATVVCNPVSSSFDWNYGVDTESGNLVAISRAY